MKNTNSEKYNYELSNMSVINYWKKQTKITLMDEYSLNDDFKKICENNDLKTVEQFLKFVKKKHNIDIIDDWGYTIFKYACKNGKLKTAKLLIELNLYLKQYNSYMFFRLACENGHLKFAKWLIKLEKTKKIKKININSCDDYTFRDACVNGNLKIAKWLIELESTRDEKIKINNNYDEVFRLACENGHIEVVKWLIELNETRDEKIQINKLCKIVFRWVCKNGHLEVAKLLIKLKKTRNNKIKINKNDDQAFKWACENGHNEVAKWLIKLEATRDEKFSKNTLKKYHKYINPKELRKRNILININNCNCNLNNMRDYYNSKCKKCIIDFRERLIDEIYEIKNMIYFHPDSNFRILDNYINIETSYFKPSEKEMERIKNIYNLEEEKLINNTMRDFTVYF